MRGDGGRRSVDSQPVWEIGVDIVTGDIKEAAEIFRPAFFDVITTNPPYMLAEHGLQQSGGCQGDRHGMRCYVHWMIFCGRAGSLLQESKGRFYMIHRPFQA